MFGVVFIIFFLLLSFATDAVFERSQCMKILFLCFSGSSYCYVSLFEVWCLCRCMCFVGSVVLFVIFVFGFLVGV